MSKRIRRTFPIYDYDKEEAWLNDMAEQGLALVRVGLWTYYFEESDPGEYQIRMQLFEKSVSSAETKDYIRFLEETGIEFIGEMFRWGYFRKKRNQGEFELYSDAAPKIRQIHSLLAMLTIIICMNIYTAITNFNLYFSTQLSMVTLAIAILSTIFTMVLGYGIWKLLAKKRELQKKDDLFE